MADATLSEAGENVLPGSNPGGGKYQASNAGAPLEPASLNAEGGPFFALRVLLRPWCWLFGHEAAPLWFFYDRGWVCPRCDGVKEPWLS